MGCCCCGSKPGCRCFCCGKRGATITFGLLGLTLAALVISGPVYIYKTDQDYSKMFPILKYGRMYLAEAAGVDITTTTTEATTSSTKESIAHAEIEDHDDEEHRLELDHAKTYRLAIFQLLDDIEAKTCHFAFFSFCIGCMNVPLHLLLLIGAIFKKSCPLVPWLVFALLELLVIGVPLIVFFGLISLYLASQLQLYVWASVLISAVVFAFVTSFSSWITVYRCYCQFQQDTLNVSYDQQLAYGNSTDGQLTQPLLGSGPSPPPLPPNHPSSSNGYHLGQYPQYYPPHGNGSSRSGMPSAPPPSGIYPSLDNA